jgi:hypothetical protein
MIRSTGRTIRRTDLQFECLTLTCTKPSLHRFLTSAARLPRPSDVSGWNSRSSGSGAKPPKTFDNTSYKRPPSTRTARGGIKPGPLPRRLLEPHILSQRLRKLCDGGQLEAAIDMLKNAPMGAQSTPVWNTLIWEVLKAQRWNLSYKLYTDVSDASQQLFQSCSFMILRR